MLQAHNRVHAGRNSTRRVRVVARAGPQATGKVTNAKNTLLALVTALERGITTSPSAKQQIMQAIQELRDAASASSTNGASSSATWELLWTSEKETLFILQNAGLFGTSAGPVYQVVDMESGYLQNVITFPPEGSFVVDSSVAPSGQQRVDFQFNAAQLRLPQGRTLGLPPFGKGWFDNVYLDDDLRVSHDSRGDWLITRRKGPAQRY